MPDILTPTQRSALMARIRSAGNASTELRLVALLRAAGIAGWRRGVRLRISVQGSGFLDSRKTGSQKDRPQSSQRAQRTAGGVHGGSTSATSVSSVVQIRRPLTVKPDFVFRKERLAVFVDGCFWHGCPLHYTRPKTRRAFWDAKIAANRDRDRIAGAAPRFAAFLASLRYAAGLVLHLWEHALKPRQLARTLARMRRALGRRARAR